jgi:cell wall assembly regulator SMI1
MTYIHYHTRRANTDEKITVGARDSMSALLNDYTVIIQPSGRPVFMDDKGRHVNVYMRLNPEDHSEYPAAVKAYHRDQQIAAQLAKDRKEQIDKLLNDLSDEEILERLTK